MEDIRVVSYNIHHARGTDDKVSLNRVAAVLACSGGQIIGLQEVDKYLPRSHFSHQPRKLGLLLQKHWVFGPNLKWRPAQYGNAVLSRWPIVKWKQHMLPSTSEQRGIIEAVININKTIPVAFFCTHLGLSQEERLKQTQVILDIISETNYPAILVGDFNDDRHSQEHALISSVFQEATGTIGGLKTFPSHQPKEQLDFIFVSPEWQVVSVFSVQSQASDHLAVVCDIRLQK